MRLYWPGCRGRICARNEKCRGWPRGINKKNITRVSLCLFSKSVVASSIVRRLPLFCCYYALSRAVSRSTCSVKKTRERERRVCVRVLQKYTSLFKLDSRRLRSRAAADVVRIPPYFRPVYLSKLSTLHFSISRCRVRSSLLKLSADVSPSRTTIV